MPPGYFCATSFDTGLLLIRDSDFAVAKRFKIYDSAAASFALCCKSLQGVVPSDLPQSRIDAFREKSGNVFVTRGYPGERLSALGGFL